MSEYDQAYFDHYGGVGPYQRNESKWLKHFSAVAEVIVKRLMPRRVIEFGCAFGFLIENLRDREVDAYGADVSEYALKQVREDIRPYCRIRSIMEKPDQDEKYDLAVCIEVFEQLSSCEETIAIENLCRVADEILFSSTPDKNHEDPKHVNVQSQDYWVGKFKENGFELDPDSDVYLVAPHAMLFRKRGRLRVTFLIDSDAAETVWQRTLRNATSLSKIGHIVTIVALTSQRPPWVDETQNVRFLFRTFEHAELRDNLPWASVLVASTLECAALVSAAPDDLGRKVFMLPDESIAKAGQSGNVNWVSSRLYASARPLSEIINHFECTHDRSPALIELDGVGIQPLGNNHPMDGCIHSKLLIGVLSLDPIQTACYYIRLAAPLADLQNKKLIQLVSVIENRNGKFEINLDAARKVDVLIVQRQFPSVLTYDKLVNNLGKDRPKIVYEIDDALTMIPNQHIDYKYYCSNSMLIEKYIREADLVTVSTEKLKAYYDSLNDKIAVIPNSLDAQIWVSSFKKKPSRKPVTILFSGSMTHAEDLKMIEDVILRVINEFGDEVQFLFWGNTSPRLQPLSQIKQIYGFFCDYKQYVDCLKNSDVDFAIIPLEDSLFNRAKSAIKWLEYSACSIPGIYSDIEAYSNTVGNGTTGILVNNTHDDWYGAIKNLIENHALRQRLALNAHLEVLDMHTVSSNSVNWLNAYKKLFSSVSIIIPAFNSPEYARRCITSIENYPPAGKYEIIIIDIGLTEGGADSLESLQNPFVKVINGETYGDVADAFRIGVSIAQYEHIVFMDQCNEVTRNWLRPLQTILERDRGVVAVSSKVITPAGRIKCAGVLIADDRSRNDCWIAKDAFVGEPSDSLEANIPRTYQALRCDCLLIQKQAFEDVGGFGDRYDRCHPEVDLCFKLIEKQWKLVYQPQSVVISHGPNEICERVIYTSHKPSTFIRRRFATVQPDISIHADGSISKENGNGLSVYNVPSTPTRRSPEGLCESNGKLISIVILTFNQKSYTKECLESIRRHTPEPHEIIFVDNGSRDGTVRWLKTVLKDNPNYKLIENTRNLGFAKGCNQGILEASGDCILLLNNDVVVTEAWASGLLECLYGAPDIGIVGPMTNIVSGTQKVPAVGYESVHELEPYAREFRERNRNRVVGSMRLVGYCMLFRRSLAQEIGMLDESFGSGNFEDDDFCLRAALAGYRNIIAGDVFIHHYGSRTFLGNKINYKRSITGNRKIFSKKWSNQRVIDFFGNRPIVINAIQRADSKHAKGHTEEAIAILVDAVRQAPSEKELVLRLADILIESKSFQKAEELLAALPDGTDSKIFSLKGICADGCGDEEKALKFSEIAISLDPSNAAALCLMGGIAYRNGHQEEAKEFFLRAIETQPGYGEAYIHLGAMKWDAGYHEESVSYFERGFILCPHSQEIAIAYHKIIAETKNFERAERVFREAASLNPNNRKIAFLYIAILIQAEKFKTAMSEIESAMERFGFDDGMLVAASRIRERIGPIEIQPRAKGATLSLCIIARNEEANMASCLMSVKGLADEIIVADTGSTDRTKTIATILGAKVFDWPWQGNFAEARNSSISRANGEWVLILDPDERLSESDHAAIKQLINDRGAKRIAYRLTTRNYTDEAGVNGWVSNDGAYPALEAGKGWFPSVKVRLFPRLPSVQFVHPVHELVEPSLQRAGFRIHECEVPVHHFGKIDRNRVIEKGKEYYRIGMQKLEQLKGDPHALKELAVQASEIGEYDHALRVWKQLIQQNPDDASAFMNAGYAHLMLRQFKQARDYSMRALELSPRFNEAAINLAAAELMAGNVDIASRLIEELLSRSPDYPPALGRMAVIRMLQGRRKDGLACIERLRGMGFDCTGAMSDQARDLMSVGRFDEALIIVEAAAESGMQSDTILALLDECRRRLSATSDIDGHESASRRRVCAMDPVEVSEHVSASL